MTYGTNTRSRSMSWTIIAIAAVMVGCGSSSDRPIANTAQMARTNATEAADPFEGSSPVTSYLAESP